MNAPTVDTFLMVLTSKLTQYDRAECIREAKRGRCNIYRLGLLFEAQDKVREDCSAMLARSDSVACEVLRASLRSRFTPRFAPASWVERQIDNWLTKGAQPKII